MSPGSQAMDVTRALHLCLIRFENRNHRQQWPITETLDQGQNQRQIQLLWPHNSRRINQVTQHTTPFLASQEFCGALDRRTLFCNTTKYHRIILTLCRHKLNNNFFALRIPTLLDLITRPMTDLITLVYTLN